MTTPSIPTVAMFNASDDTVEMLKSLFAVAGFRAVDGHVDEMKSGEMDFLGFLNTHTPDAIVWDVAPPYDRNWNFFNLIRRIGPLQHSAIVLTTTQKPHLDDRRIVAALSRCCSSCASARWGVGRIALGAVHKTTHKSASVLRHTPSGEQGDS